MDPLPLLEHTEYRLDESGALSLAEVRALTESWQSTDGRLSLGYRPDAVWLRVRLQVLETSRWRLWVSPPFLDRVTLHHIGPDGVIQHWESGDHVPLTQRPVAYRQFLFPLSLQPGPHDLYVRIQTRSALSATLSLLPVSDTPSMLDRETLHSGMLLGLVILAVWVSLLFWGLTREPMFLWASAYLASFGGLHAVLNGFDQEYLYPETPWWADRVIGVLGFLVAATLTGTLRHYLPFKDRAPRVDLGLLGLVGLYGLGGVLSACGYYPALAPVYMASVLALTVLLFGLTLWIWTAAPQRAGLVLLTLAPGLLAALLQTARNLGVLPSTWVTTHLWGYSGMLQVLFVVFALLLRVREHERAALADRIQSGVLRRFYNLMAHELRTPLAIISAAVANLDARWGHQPDITTRLQRIKGALTRLDMLVDNALLEERLVTQWQFPAHAVIETVDLVELAREVVSLRPMEDSHQLIVTVNGQSLTTPKVSHPNASPTPPQAQTTQGDRVTLAVDRRWLVLALLNLLDNAVKYSPEGGTVTLDIREEEGGVVFEVADEGIGIPPQDRPHLFERGFRGAAADGGVPGLGLGLYLVAQVAGLGQGDITLEARVRGSLFRLRFPRVATPSDVHRTPM